MLVVVDMGLSNLGSVVAALRRVGAEPQVSERAEDVEAAEAVVLPGVGAYGDGMAALHDRGLVEPIRLHARAGKPLLGICLGSQLLADGGDEHGRTEGLGLVPGRTIRLEPGAGLRVPNIGWCDVAVNRPSALFDPGAATESFYFAHSFHVRCEDPADVVATIDYGGPVAAVIERDTVTGVQFHPEKSQDAGLAVLGAFVAHRP